MFASPWWTLKAYRLQPAPIFLLPRQRVDGDLNTPIPPMKFTISLVSLVLLCSLSFAQTTPTKRKLSESQTLLWCAYGTTGLAVAFHGIHETQFRKDRLFFNGAGNAALFATGALLVTALERHTTKRQKAKGLALDVSPVGFNLSYHF